MVFTRAAYDDVEAVYNVAFENVEQGTALEMQVVHAVPLLIL